MNGTDGKEGIFKKVRELSALFPTLVYNEQEGYQPGLKSMNVEATAHIKG